jgi:hypothetical protein
MELSLKATIKINLPNLKPRVKKFSIYFLLKNLNLSLPRWNSFTEGKGEFKGITKTTVRNASNNDNTDIVIMDLEFTQNKEQLFVIFDDSKSIIGVDFIQ